MSRYYKKFPPKSNTAPASAGTTSSKKSAPDFPDTLTTYLGPKGYTILKSELDKKQLDYLVKQLTIKPVQMGGGSVFAQNQPSYPVYRESGKKMYMPVHFGIQHLGPPKEITLSEGMSAEIKFAGQLREHQIPAVNGYLNHVKNAHYGGGLLELPCAFGKTALSLYIMSQLKKKTLVIVHKEFLMNQWAERIQQFVPTARVGKIQAQVVDVENKDIVLCMLQSLVLKEYDSSLFEQFGFTVIDEVHHISSEVFSRALFKIVTRYMLGLSATMERKDGTTYVFKMFLGDVVYKAERQTSDSVVEVRAMTFQSNDPEFNEVITDFRDQPQTSSMISKLCSYNRRTEFIVQTLCDFIRVPIEPDTDAIEFKTKIDSENPECGICGKKDNYLVRNTCCDAVKYCLLCMERTVEEQKAAKKRPKCILCKKSLAFEQNYIENPYVKPKEQTQTIVLSHNLNILEYIYKKFVCKNLASVGYYVGGMSESELKKSESKQVILGTYAMASEGLDIPSLNAEFLITPKTDIVQTVGRILRSKHAFSHPIIYDFVDTHDLFQRQWSKRKAYYKKNGYKIVGISSTNYVNDVDKWRVLYDPNPVPKASIGCTTTLGSVNKGIKKQTKINSMFMKQSSPNQSDESGSDESDAKEGANCMLTHIKFD